MNTTSMPAAKSITPKQVRIETLFDQFKALGTRRKTKKLEKMGSFLIEFETRQIELDRQRPASFNFFELFRVGSSEVWHTQFLAWLLNARADHGQGDLFFRAFVAACKLPLPVDSIRRYQVRPEINLSESIPDIVIFAPRQFLILVENKIYAAEGVDQLGREYRDLKRMADSLEVPKSQRFAVFLTPRGQQPITADDPAHWITLSYRRLATALADDTATHINDKKVCYLLADWRKTVISFGE